MTLQINTNNIYSGNILMPKPTETSIYINGVFVGNAYSVNTTTERVPTYLNKYQYYNNVDPLLPDTLRQRLEIQADILDGVEAKENAGLRYSSMNTSNIYLELPAPQKDPTKQCPRCIVVNDICLYHQGIDDGWKAARENTSDED